MVPSKDDWGVAAVLQGLFEPQAVWMLHQAILTRRSSGTAPEVRHAEAE